MQLNEFLDQIVGEEISEDELISRTREKLGKHEFFGERKINAMPSDKVLIRNRQTGELKCGVVIRPQLILMLFNNHVVCTTLCNLKRVNEVQFWR